MKICKSCSIVPDDFYLAGWCRGSLPMQEAFQLYGVLPIFEADYDYPHGFKYFMACGDLHFSQQKYNTAYRYHSHLEKKLGCFSAFDQARLHYYTSLTLQFLLEDKSLALIYSDKAYHYFSKVNNHMGLYSY